MLTVEVPPRSALRLFTISNYPGNDLRRLHRFPVVMIEIADEETSVTVEDERALLALQRWNEDLYVFPAYEVELSR